MICLVDQNLPPSPATWLQANGTVAVHVSKIGLGAAGDSTVIALARAKGHTVITKDEDFAFSGPPPVVWVRLGNVTNAHLMSAFEANWSAVRAALEASEALLELR